MNQPPLKVIIAGGGVGGVSEVSVWCERYN